MARDSYKGKKILVVEDSEIQAAMLKKILVDAGYDVKTARNGAEGLGMAREEGPHLIISDIIMPVMDGFQMCMEIKKDPALKDIPLMLLTQLEEPEEVIKGLATGADNYVTKPYSVEYMIAKTRSLLSPERQIKNLPENKCIEFEYNGKTYRMRSGRVQTVSFLLSTYENAVWKNRELVMAHEELKRLNEGLEDAVRKRTEELTNEVAERKSAEKALIESEKRFRSVVETANDAIIGIKPPGVVYIWNKKAEEAFGWSSAEAMGRDVHELIAPQEYREKALKELKGFFLTGQGPIVGKTRELDALRKDGSVFPIELSISAINIEGEWHSIGILRDITERKKAEAGLKKNLDETERMNRLMVGREIKMAELRDTIRRLEARVKELEGAETGA
jgi:PAS domain S-box-containing protein